MSILLQPEKQHDRGLWSYISASRLNLWSKCPLAFRFRYIDGIVTPTTANLFLGKVVHAALEAYYRQRQIGLTPTPDEADDLAETAWHVVSEEEPMLWNSSDESAKCRKQATDLVQAYIREYATQSEHIVAMETTLETPLLAPHTGEDLGVSLFGIVDLVLETSLDNKSCEDEPTNGRRPTGGRRLPGSNGLPLALVDFKTAASASLATEQAHAVQLTLYSLLLLCREYLDSLDRNTFNYRPCWSCSMCDYRDLCGQ